MPNQVRNAIPFKTFMECPSFHFGSMNTRYPNFRTEKLNKQYQTLADPSSLSIAGSDIQMFLLDDETQWLHLSLQVILSWFPFAMTFLYLLISLCTLFPQVRSRAIWSSEPASWGDIIQEAYIIGNGRLGG
jgi:hypothetical protein